jgi:hypothetical protein
VLNPGPFSVLTNTNSNGATQTYRDYLDEETSVIKRPEGADWSDPFGDGVWRSSWFYASLILIKGHDPQNYATIYGEHGVGIEEAGNFLKYFAANNIQGEEWSLPKNPSQKFSRDQLAPLLLMLAAVNVHEVGLRADAKIVTESLVEIIKDKAAVSDSAQGEVGENLRYVVDVLARQFGIDYIDAATRAVYKAAFTTSLKLDNILVQLPVDAATLNDFSVFNRLALVSLQCVIWGKADSDVVDWRENYKLHADKGWGPAFRLVAGRSVDAATIDSYRGLKSSRTLDNDIILAQRPKKYLDATFPPQVGDQIVLDYVLLLGLESMWR